MSKAKPNYHEFTTLPDYAAPVWKGEKVLNAAHPYKWSGTVAPPAIGAEVTVYMNGLGAGVVAGYFAEYGWLGVLVRFKAPPKWWRDQTKARGENPATTCGHLFGLDLEPRAKAV